MKKSEMRELSARALHAAMREDWPAVKQAFADISADGHAITFALMAWCDTALSAQAEMRGMPEPGNGPMGELVVPAWYDPQTRTLVRDADALPPAHRWAGRLLAARAAMDLTQFQVLVGTMPRDGFERGQWALALLCSTAALVSASQGQGAA